jgi:hypothetical protein
MVIHVTLLQNLYKSAEIFEHIVSSSRQDESQLSFHHLALRGFFLMANTPQGYLSYGRSSCRKFLFGIRFFSQTQYDWSHTHKGIF